MLVVALVLVVVPELVVAPLLVFVLVLVVVPELVVAPLLMFVLVLVVVPELVVAPLRMLVDEHDDLDRRRETRAPFKSGGARQPSCRVGACGAMKQG